MRALTQRSPLVRYFAGGYSDGRAKSTGRRFVVGGRHVTPLKEALTALAGVRRRKSYSTGFALTG
jgi:hypothetical protein